jgi:hypothetical protein
VQCLSICAPLTRVQVLSGRTLARTDWLTATLENSEPLHKKSPPPMGMDCLMNRLIGSNNLVTVTLFRTVHSKN